MLNFIAKVYQYLCHVTFKPEPNQPPIVPGKYSDNKNKNQLYDSSELKQSQIALTALLLFANRLEALMLHVGDLLRQGRLDNEIEQVQSELATLDQQFLQLSPLVIAYEQNTTGEINYDLISADLAKNLETLGNSLKSSDIIIREFNFGCDRQTKAALLFVDGLTDKDAINNTIMKPLMYDKCLLEKGLATPIWIDGIQKNLLSASDVKKVGRFSDLLDKLLSGRTILLVDSLPEALVINAAKWESRGVDKPEMENVVRGPREGFSESLRINTSLLRRKIHNPHLCFETVTIGEQTNTNVCIAYLANIVNPRLITEIKNRLQRINTDAILDSGYIESFIEDAPYSIFPTIANSEKPDVVAAKLLEGRAAILVDGSPIVLTAPMLFFESFQTPEDYYIKPYYATLLRLIRFQAYLSSIFSPAVYVALITFHQELIPTQLLITLTAGREKVPFSAALEAFGMGVAFEILREAGIRLPRPIGSAVSIVGALVIGQTAVSAGLISPIMVIVVGITAIASFAVPAHADSSAILRFVLLLSAGLAGGFGILMVLLIVLLHLTCLRSFGTPFLSPLAPLTVSDLKDTFVRMPLWAMLTRPRTIRKYNIIRQQSKLMPSPPNRD